jgi:uncharacterized protein YjiS (DUF1127 family)
MEMIMSTLSGIAPYRAGAGTVVHIIGNTLMRWWVAYTTWRIEQLAISRLSEMSERQLKDIGIVRSEIEFAVKADRRHCQRARCWF